MDNLNQSILEEAKQKAQDLLDETNRKMIKNILEEAKTKATGLLTPASSAPATAPDILEEAKQKAQDLLDETIRIYDAKKRMIEDILEQAKRKANSLLVGSSSGSSSGTSSGNYPTSYIDGNDETNSNGTNTQNTINQSTNDQSITGSDDVVFTFESFENNMKKGETVVKKFSLPEKKTSEG